MGFLTMSNTRNANRSYRWMVAAALVPMVLGSTPPTTDADSVAPSLPGKERAVTLERVAGSPIKRVVLGPKAAERLGVKTGAVGEQAIVPTQMVGGIVIHPSAAGAVSPTPPEARGSNSNKSSPGPWVRVALSPPEWSRLAGDKPVRIFPLETRASLARGLIAMPAGRPPLDNAKSGMLTLFFIVPSDNSGLVPGDRVRVELQLDGGKEKQKVVPYSAVYYDAKGDAWVYVNTAPLAFMRQRITVTRVAGDLALLSSGPEVGTPVATVGVSLLYGAEIFGK
jgi:hypothetical protein